MLVSVFIDRVGVEVDLSTLDDLPEARRWELEAMVANSVQSWVVLYDKPWQPGTPREPLEEIQKQTFQKRTSLWV